MTNYRSESTGFQPRGHRRRLRIRKKYRERKAKEFVDNLNKRELAELRAAIEKHDAELPPGAEDLRQRSGLEIWESLQRRGRHWLDRMRGKQ